MGQEYISYIQTEELLKVWPTIQGIKESLERELKLYRYTDKMGDKEDYVYTKIIGNKELKDTPPPINRISDSTGATALNVGKQWEKDVQDMRERLLEEKLYIDLVNDKLDIAFKRLTPIQQEILKLFYWQNKTWSEVLESLKQKNYMSKHQAQMQRRQAIEMIQSISKITVDMYKYVLDLVEVD